MGASIRAEMGPAMRNASNAAVLRAAPDAGTQHNLPMRNVAGVTLIELLFGLAIVAILAGMAVPGFQQTLRAAAVRAATYELLAGVQQTRGGSIVESRP